MCFPQPSVSGSPAPGSAASGTAASGTAGMSAAEALAAVRAGLAFLATVDATELTTAEQADVLRGLASAESVHLAATSSVLRAFTASRGCIDDAQPTARSWLRWQARITNGAAGAAMAWMRRLDAHSMIAATLARGEISPSWARHLSDWSDRLPAGDRDAADQILLRAAAGGAGLADLAGLAEEMFRRSASPDTDKLNDGFADRVLRLTPHYQGHARLEGHLTPAAAAALRAVLDSLNARIGPEDMRTPGQREHDALEEACRRLVASGGLPDRAGQPTHIQLHMTLEQLLGLPGARDAVSAWTATQGAAPEGADCDATIIPIVTGSIDPEVLDQLAGALLDRRADDSSADDSSASGGMAMRAAGQLAISRAVALLSGPGGLASWLRTRQLHGLAATVSLPLDTGAATDTIPVHLRRAITRRDQHCRFPGCEQPPAACHVHHLIPRSEGGPTSLQNCLLLCAFHHLTAIHRWGWTLTLSPDGTTTATSPGADRILRNHAPPVAA